jgi:hypothetical protein
MIGFRRCHKPDILRDLEPSALPEERRCHRIAMQEFRRELGSSPEPFTADAPGQKSGRARRPKP